jgi:hypothetical protein
MPISQNVRFAGESPPDPDSECDHPAGAAIARRIEAALRTRGFAAEPLGNWRDVGWAVRVRSAGACAARRLTRRWV